MALSPMDRRRRASRSVSRSPRRHRRRSRSPSARRSIVTRHPQSVNPGKSWSRGKRPAERYYQHPRSPSERRQERGGKWSRDAGNSARGFCRRSRSCSPPVHGASRQFSSNVRRRSPSPRARVFKQHRRSRSPRRRSPSPYQRKPVQRRRSPSPSPRRRCPSPRRRSPIPQHWSNASRRRSVSTRGHSVSYRGRSASSRGPSPSSSPHQRSPSARRSSSFHRRSRSPRRNDWDRRSRSRSDSRPRRSEDAESRSGSSRGRSGERSEDRASAEPLAPKLSPAGSAASVGPSVPQRQSAGSTTTLIVDTPPKAVFAEEKQDDAMRKVAAPAREDRTTDGHRSLMQGSNGDHRGGQTHVGAHGYNHYVNNRRLFVHNARASSSSPAAHRTPTTGKPLTHGAPIIGNPLTHGTPTFVKPATISDRGVTSPPHVERTSTSTPAATQHTCPPVVNPVLEKKREAQRESHRAYLKSNSEYNRAEVNYVTHEAELRLAEFWLEIRTKNLEDVGKRIEVHDWNFQKIMAPGGSDEA